VTSQDLVDFSAHGIKIERRRIQLDEPIKTLGETTVSSGCTRTSPPSSRSASSARARAARQSGDPETERRRGVGCP
jgi:hypothetical protein